LTLKAISHAGHRFGGAATVPFRAWLIYDRSTVGRSGSAGGPGARWRAGGFARSSSKAVELEARCVTAAAGVELPPAPDIAGMAIARLDRSRPAAGTASPR